MSYQRALELIEEEKQAKTTQLDLSNQELKTIPPQITELTYLKKLDFGGNQISDIRVLEKLTGLRFLYLNSNRISDISVLEKLTDLSALYLNSNQISDIRVLEKLTDLRTLYLNSNQISDISVLKKLVGLDALNLNSNKISDIRFLEKLTSLKYLNLSSNQITDINFLEKLIRLQVLNLSSNRISDISVLKKLTNLVTLDLRVNQIKDMSPLLSLIQIGVPVVIRSIFSSFTINLYNNPLEICPESVVLQGKAAILRYFEELEHGEEHLYEAKLLIVGEGGAGKTSLRFKLKDANAALPKEEERTRGIDIVSMSFPYMDGKTFTLNVWDFGGQDIYHATHRFFLTRRSLYVLMTDTRRKDPNFDYWIPNIQLFGGDSPIITVRNLFDGHKGEALSLRRFKQHEQFNLVGNLMDVNLKSTEGLETLCKFIFQHATMLPHIGEKVPKTWKAVRQELLQLVKEQPYINYEDFVALCKKNNIEDALKIADLANYLHDLGIILWYRQLQSLKHKVILRPQWATNAVYQVIDAKIVEDKKGAFTKADLEKIWTDSDYRAMQDELLELMIAFRLCYQKQDRSGFIIPSMMPAEPAEDPRWDTTNNLCLQYEYSFMPKGIINQLTTELSRYIKDDKLVWNRGVILQDEDTGTEAKIEEDWLQRKIDIHVKGIDARGMLKLIMNSLNNIHDTYEGIEAKKKVPCICGYCKNSHAPNLIAYDELISLLQKGKKEYFCNVGYGYLDKQSDAFVGIEQLLFNVGISVAHELERGGRFFTTDFYLSEEKEGLQRHLEMLIKKRNQFLLDKEVVSDAAQKFQLNVELEQLEKAIADTKEKIQAIR